MNTNTILIIGVAALGFWYLTRNQAPVAPKKNTKVPSFTPVNPGGPAFTNLDPNAKNLITYEVGNLV